MKIMKTFNVCRKGIKMQRFKMQNISLDKVTSVWAMRAFLVVGWWILSLQSLPLNRAQIETKVKNGQLVFKYKGCATQYREIKGQTIFLEAAHEKCVCDLPF